MRHYLSSVWAGLFSLTLSGEAVAEAFRLPLHAQQQAWQQAFKCAVATRSYMAARQCDKVRPNKLRCVDAVHGESAAESLQQRITSI